MRTRYVDFDDRNKDLAERMRAAPELAEDFLRKWEVSWLYHENALEGVVYTSQELTLGLENQPVADATFVGALREIRNHKAALDLARAEGKAKKVRLNVSLAKKLYETLGAGTDGRSTAEWRKDMPIHRSYFHDIALPPKIPTALQKVFDLCETSDFRNAHPIQQAVKLQHGFMQVFPFTENSGRVARLLSNLLLFQVADLPVIIHATDRQRYYESFRQPESALRELTFDALDNGLTTAEKVFAAYEKTGGRKMAR